MTDSENHSQTIPEVEIFENSLGEFFLEDYKQKIAYLTAHLGRMWTRFNFFLTAEAALVTYFFTSDRAVTKVSTQLAAIELFVSIIWLVFGIKDHSLVSFYRRQIKDALTSYLRTKIGSAKLTDEVNKLIDNYSYAGASPSAQLAAPKAQEGPPEGKGPESTLSPEQEFIEWMSEAWNFVSITTLAFLVPLLVSFAWIIVILNLLS